MAGPNRPNVNRPIGPVPIGPRPPRPFIPWTPFGPGDNAAPDVDALVAAATELRVGLEKAQLELTGMRDGPGPDGTAPVVREVTRADGLWPYLLIRTYPKDVGKRPFTFADVEDAKYGSAVDSPDVIITAAGPPGEAPVIERSGILGLKARELGNLYSATEYDVWAHVWNLGKFRATGVRIRAWVGPLDWGIPTLPAERYLGGIAIDLGDRLSDTAHRAVKVATFTSDNTGNDYAMLVTVTAECLSDPATGNRAPGADRHSAHCAISVA